MSKFNKIFYWSLVILIIYLIIEILRKIFGGSLGFEELASTLFVANLGYNYDMHSNILKINSKI